MPTCSSVSYFWFRWLTTRSSVELAVQFLKPQSLVLFTSSSRSSVSVNAMQPSLSKPDVIIDVCAFVTRTRSSKNMTIENQFRLGKGPDILLGSAIWLWYILRVGEEGPGYGTGGCDLALETPRDWPPVCLDAS